MVKHLTFICINTNEAFISLRYSKISNPYGLRIHMIFFSVFIAVALMMAKHSGGTDASLEVICSSIPTF